MNVNRQYLFFIFVSRILCFIILGILVDRLLVTGT